MQTLMDVVKSHLTKHGRKPERKGSRLRSAIHGQNGIWYLRVSLNEDDRWLVCQSILPFEIPPTLRQKVALLITQLNYAMIIGNYELDFSDGELTLKTSLRLSEDELTDSMLEDLLACNFSTFDEKLPGFMALVYGRRSVTYCTKLQQENGPEPEEMPSQPQLPPANQPGSDSV